MGKIDEQIQLLLTQKKKISLLQDVLTRVNGITSDDKVALEYVQNLVNTFVQNQITTIESGGEPTNEGLSEESAAAAPLSSEEVGIFRAMMRKVADKVSDATPKNKGPKDSQGLTQLDKASFAKKYASWGQRLVKISTKSGDLEGTVISLAPPRIMVMSNETREIDAYDPRDLELIGD